jgi:uncharacterized protein (TIGR02246 family)
MSEPEIESVGTAFVAAWNSHDMQALSLLFKEDAEFVNVYGTWLTGRGSIEAQHAAVHASVFLASNLVSLEMRAKHLHPDVAHLHMRWKLDGIQAPNGIPLPERAGVMLFVIVRDGGSWRIAAAQNTDITSPPAPPR